MCVYTVCVSDRALTQPAKCRNILLHWIGTILKRWHEDYYSIWLHQICTIPKWYYTSLSSRVVYPFKWTFISHVLKQRPWRGTIQRRLPCIWRLLFFRVSDGFLLLENTEAEFLCQHKYHSVKLKHFYILKLLYQHVHNMYCCDFYVIKLRECILCWRYIWLYYIHSTHACVQGNLHCLPILKAKISPKCNLGFFCECICVKPSCESIITTKEALLRFTVFSFLGPTHFQWQCYGHFYDSIKISVFKTLRRLDTTLFIVSPGSLQWTRALRT